MQNIAPNTLFTGRQLIYLPACSSTNSVAQDLLIKNKATEGCVVVTDSQTQGRGQRGNTWEAEPHKNITLSLVLKPTFLGINQQFYLNICISLGVLDFVKNYLPPQSTIKWPNDLYYENNKIGGILIENSVSGHFLQHAIVGIGLNINQVSFLYMGASSFARITDKFYGLSDLISDLLEKLEVRYLELKAGQLDKLKFDYLQSLFRFQEPHLYLIQGKVTTGVILGIDETGRLSLDINNSVNYFDLKEIAFII